MSERQSRTADVTGTATMKPIYVRRVIGGTAVLFGVWLSWEIIHPVVTRLPEGSWESMRLPFLSILPLMLLPCILLTLFGIRLYRAMSVQSLKWVLGLVATLGALWGSSEFSKALPGVLPERIETSAFTLVSSLIAFGAYLAALWLILPCLQLIRPNLGTLVGRAGLMLMALQIWLLLSGIFREYSPIEEGYTHVPEEPWGILGVAVPIFVAYGGYRMAFRLLHKAQQAAPADDTAEWRPVVRH